MLKVATYLRCVRACKDLQVSLITTKRAYEDLEKEGFVTTVRGKGTFVKEQDSSILKRKAILCN